MSQKSFQQIADQLTHLFAEIPGAGVDGVEAELSRLGKGLPRWAQRDVALLRAALQAETHPVFEAQPDAAKLNRSLRRIRRYLDQTDPEAQRKTSLKYLAAFVAFAVLVTFAQLILVLLWRGVL